jgi:hypothetical protein
VLKLYLTTSSPGTVVAVPRLALTMAGNTLVQVCEGRQVAVATTIPQALKVRPLGAVR